MKVKSQYVCQSCGYAATKWLGRCPGCEAWSTLVEERATSQSSREAAIEAAGLHGTLLVDGLAAGRQPWVSLDPEQDVGSTSSKGKAQPQARITTGISELDRV